MTDSEPLKHSEARYGPSPDAIGDALDAIVDADVPGVPPVGALKTLNEAGIEPGTGGFLVHDRRVKDWRIAKGQPQHGEFRSDDHVARYVVQYARECPRCSGEWLHYEYRTQHNIAGFKLFHCPRCNHKLVDEEWG